MVAVVRLRAALFILLASPEWRLGNRRGQLAVLEMVVAGAPAGLLEEASGAKGIGHAVVSGRKCLFQLFPSSWSGSFSELSLPLRRPGPPALQQG